MTLVARVRDLGDGRLAFKCPACREDHVFRITGAGAWDYNGNPWRPTLTPSILVTGKHWLTDAELKRVMAGGKVKPKDKRCHAYITDGMIEFLGDSLHDMAGQTVQLPRYGD